MTVFTEITTAPTAPSRDDPTNFRTRADAYVDWQSGDMVPEINTIVATLNDAMPDLWLGTSTTSMTIGTGSQSFTVAETLLFFGVGSVVRISDDADPTNNYMDGAITAYTGSTGAMTVLVTAIGGAGTKTAWSITPMVPTEASRVRTWSTMAGSAAVPLIVSHGGEYYYLASNLADVTAKTPGVDAEWVNWAKEIVSEAEAKAGTATTRRAWTAQRVKQAVIAGTSWTVISSATNAVTGGHYLCDTSAGVFTLTLPAAPAVGDYVRIMDAERTFVEYNLTIGRNGLNIEETAEDLTVDETAAFVLVYRSVAIGWRIG